MPATHEHGWCHWWCGWHDHHYHWYALQSLNTVEEKKYKKRISYVLRDWFQTKRAENRNRLCETKQVCGVYKSNSSGFPRWYKVARCIVMHLDWKRLVFNKKHVTMESELANNESETKTLARYKRWTKSKFLFFIILST